MTTDEQKICETCGTTGEIIETENLAHYAKCVCPKCDKWLDWVKNPENGKNQNRAEHKKLIKLVNESMRDFCWNCSRDKQWLSQLKPSLHLVAHHIIEVCNGGQDTAENIQILCNECHSDVHHRRQLHQRYKTILPPTTNQ